MAAGKGTRIGATDKPKVMFEVAGKPIIEWAIAPLLKLKEEGLVDRIITVVGFFGDQVIDCLGQKSEYVWQKDQLGTGHAARQAQSLIGDEEGLTVIVNGDHVLYTQDTYRKVITEAEKQNLTLVLSVVNSETDFDDYGRVIRANNGKVEEIVELKDTNELQKKISERNINLYVADNKWLFGALSKVRNENAKKEFYLTDIIKIAVDDREPIEAIRIDRPEEAIGINTEEDRLKAEEILNKKV